MKVVDKDIKFSEECEGMIEDAELMEVAIGAAVNAAESNPLRLPEELLVAVAEIVAEIVSALEVEDEPVALLVDDPVEDADADPERL
jgi:hypothetical protein